MLIWGICLLFLVGAKKGAYIFDAQQRGGSVPCRNADGVSHIVHSHSRYFIVFQASRLAFARERPHRAIALCRYGVNPFFFARPRVRDPLSCAVCLCPMPEVACEYSTASCLARSKTFVRANIIPRPQTRAWTVSLYDEWQTSWRNFASRATVLTALCPRP